jgi:hypothetical protein
MLRTLMFLILLASCSPKKVYLEPRATFHGRVVIFDPDPLCRVKKGKRSEKMLEDLLRYNMWGYLNEVKVPYKQPQKSLTTTRCEY